MSRYSILLLAVAASTPVQAQETDVGPPRAIVSPAPPPATTAIDDNVAPFYAAHPGTLIWLRSTDTRSAASRLIDILQRSPVDGLSDGPVLAAQVQSALASGTPADDQIISRAWVRYVQTLMRPVEGVAYGDPKLQLRPRSPAAILASLAAAPSLASALDAVANVNPIYASLRSDALASGQQNDPRVRATLDRLRLVPGSGRAIVVDVANAQLMLLEAGQAVDTMKVIVGKPDFATPLLAGTIHYVTFNPYWHIPQDVAKRKVAPIVLKRGVGYLKAARYETVEGFGGDREQPIDPATVDWKAVAAGTADAHIRQLSGPQNMMGKMKFGFQNDYGIFLHDTPHKELFKKDVRTLSLGCVRVEHPERLAAWLLDREPVPPGDDSEQNVLIDRAVPIFITYLTARPDEGQIRFATDVYKLDSPSASSVAVSSNR